jgi:hypothetical protein
MDLGFHQPAKPDKIGITQPLAAIFYLVAMLFVDHLDDSASQGHRSAAPER